MRLYITGETAKTAGESPVIDFVEVVKNGKTITFTWDESESGVNDNEFDFRGKGVVKDDGDGGEIYMNGLLSEVKNADLYYICIRDKETEAPDESFIPKEMVFSDDDNGIYKVPVSKITTKEPEEFVIVPTEKVFDEILCVTPEQALLQFVAKMDSDMSAYFKALPKNEFIKIQTEHDSAAHKQFVMSFMKDTLVTDFSVDEKDSERLSSFAYDIYAEGNGLTEYEAVEKAYNTYSCLKEKMEGN